MSVYNGTWTPRNSTAKAVHIGTLNDHATKFDRDILKQELEALTRALHRNVLQLLGVTCRGEVCIRKSCVGSNDNITYNESTW